VGGLASLTLDSLDLLGHQAVLREKGGRTHVAYFTDRTELALSAYLARDRQVQEERLLERGVLVSGRVWLGLQGPLTTSGVYLILKRLARKAGVRGRYNPHSIRHAWARNAIVNRRASLGEVSKILGHADIATTARWYAIWLDVEIKERHGEITLLRQEKESVI
jgi:site-specific recombinase XerD